jgi:membrane protease YdiL (CAAX protease family)
MDQVDEPLWRHPGFLLLYSIGATMLAVTISVLLVKLLKGQVGMFGELLIGVLVAAVFVTIYVLFCRLFERRPAREFAPRQALPDLAAGTGFGIAIFSCVVGVIAACGGYRIAGFNSASAALPMLAVAIFSGFSEEIVFRGFLMRLIEKWLGTWAGLGISSLLFGLAHLGNSFVGPVAVAAIVEAGLMLAAIYLLTRRLWAAVAVHGAWNFAQGGIFGIAVSGGHAQGIIRPGISGSNLLTGGAFGAEASLPAVIVLAIASLALLYLAWRRGQFMAPIWVRRRQAQGVGEQV